MILLSLWLWYAETSDLVEMLISLPWDVQIFLAAESAAVTVQTTNGYGKPDADLSDHQLTTVLKVRYL